MVRRDCASSGIWQCHEFMEISMISQTREIEDPLTAIIIPLISHVQKHAFETRQITHAMVT